MDNQQRSLERDLSWLGGIIDGEGMITAMTRNERGREQHAYVPRISIVNTNPYIINECLKILEATKIPHYVQTKKGKGTWKTKIEIIIGGFKRVSHALPILMPYIRGKRKQAEGLQALCIMRLAAPRSTYTETEHQLVADIRRINHGDYL